MCNLNQLLTISIPLKIVEKYGICHLAFLFLSAEVPYKSP